MVRTVYMGVSGVSEKGMTLFFAVYQVEMRDHSSTEDPASTEENASSIKPSSSDL
jgi:hypothetical protein